ncbi:zinc finger protein 674-like [Anopheles nili]|uniref:zinc finger protein 674-like n=1 Tax=Anopheles nili TaxID=185578 RepID=UPI00237B752F|nr:zinc finger protein 674-like [Anopheles nili]
MKIIVLVHERTHTHEKPYICCRCPKAFAAKDRLIAHERTHQGAYAFECEFCTRKFNTNKALSRHRLLKHDQAVQSFEPHGCSQCGQLLLSQSAASYHTRHQCVEEKKKMRTRQESVRCALCKQLFLTQHHLETHLAEWHGTQELEQHLQRNREKERTHKYPCEVCGRKFKQKIVLTRHRQRHDGVRPYRCEICGRTFVQKGTLKTHMRTHTDDKPFLCARCGEGFRSAASRQYHWMKTGCEEDKPDDSTKDPPKSNNDINELMSSDASIK